MNGAPVPGVSSNQVEGSCARVKAGTKNEPPRRRVTPASPFPFPAPLSLPHLSHLLNCCSRSCSGFVFSCSAACSPFWLVQEARRNGSGGEGGGWQHFACRSTWRHVASRRHRGVERRWNPLLVLLQVTCSFNASAPWAEANKLWEQASVQRLPEQEQGAVAGGSGAESPEMPR